MEFEYFGRITPECAAFVDRYHYSKSHHIACRAVGIWRENKQLIAACLLAPVLSARTGMALGLDLRGKILELNRLVRHPETNVPLTALIGATVKAAARSLSVGLYCSYADFTHTHHGGIYQAASWRFAGIRKPKRDGFVVDGQLRSNRAASAMYKSAAKSHMEALGGIPHYDRGKLFYWRATDRKGLALANQLGWQNYPYPKPEINPWVPIMGFQRKDGPGPQKELNILTGEIRLACLTANLKTL